MIKKLLFASILVLGSGACSDAQTAHPASASGAGVAASPKLAFTDNHVEYKGQRLTFEQSLSAWEDVLGPNHRPALSDAPDIVVWDELGIRVYTNYPKDLNVRNVAVTLKGPPEDSLAYIAPGDGVRPRREYDGAVSVSGVSVDRNTRVGDIPRLSKNQLRVDCSRGINLCTASRIDDRFIQISTYFGVDDRRYDSVPYEIEFGQASDESP